MCIRDSFLHVVSAHADAIELGHICRAIAEDIADDPHGAFGRIDISVANHEFFEDVILNRTAQLLGRYSLPVSYTHLCLTDFLD